MIHVKVLSLVLVLVYVLFQLLPVTTAQKYYDFRCSDNYTSGGVYQLNLAAALQNLTSQAALSIYFTSSYGNAPNEVHSGYFCRGDIALSLSLCHFCLGNATQMIARICPDQIAGVIWYDLCTVGYSPEPFLSKFVPYYEIAVRSNQNVTGDVAGFNRAVNDTVEKVAEAAVEDGVHRSRFATREANFSGGGGVRVYTLAQCSPLLAAGECRKCLSAGIELLPGCCSGRVGGRVLLPTCNLRYEIFPFYGVDAGIPQSGVGEGSKKKDKHIGGIIGGIAGGIVMLLLLATWLIFYRRKTEISTHKPNKADMDEITSAESLQFDFSKIRAATNNFSTAKKLGQGGFGVVYKGQLENGQEVAVKRLSETSGQGIEEFKTELVLVAKLQHRNLVKMLGFCLSEKEKLLVYEYLPNSSLDKFLSEPDKRASLDWPTRFKIISGIARGLLYLHEDSRLKIIHRDLKSSNILLDEGMNAKISDFGLAKLFGVDQTQDDTNRIVGTYGYMAPEYALAGHFSVKSDVYSFGIIVLEIVSGQKNRFFSRPQDEEALQFRAWKYWNDGAPLELVDPSLSKNYSIEEVMRCIQIGLLCIQDNASNRPNMALVVAAFSGQSVKLAQPLPPNFLISSTATSSTTVTFTSGSTSQTTSDYSNSTAFRKKLPGDDESQYTATTDITEMHPR